MANAFTATRTARPWKVAADWTIFSWRVARFSNFYMAEIWLIFLLQSLLLNYFTEIQITFKVAFFLCSFIDSFFVFSLFGLSFANLENIIIIEFRHFVWIFKEILLQISQLFFDHCFPFVFINFFDGCIESFVSTTKPGLWCRGWHYFLYRYNISLIILTNEKHHKPHMSSNSDSLNSCN